MTDGAPRPILVRLIVRHVDHVVRVDGDVARPAELLPFSDELSVRIEDLDAAVAAVGDENPKRVRFAFERGSAAPSFYHPSWVGAAIQQASAASGPVWAIVASAAEVPPVGPRSVNTSS
jgi:hypothetical protein